MKTTWYLRMHIYKIQCVHVCVCSWSCEMIHDTTCWPKNSSRCWKMLCMQHLCHRMSAWESTSMLFTDESKALQMMALLENDEVSIIYVFFIYDVVHKLQGLRATYIRALFYVCKKKMSVMRIYRIQNDIPETWRGWDRRCHDKNLLGVSSTKKISE